MSELWTGKFWLASIERAIKSFAGALLALLGSNVLSVTDVDWSQAAGVGALAALSSILLSITSAGIGNHGPSLGPETLKEK